MIRIYSQHQLGKNWLQQYQGCCPIFACVLGFTATGLIPGISAAGKTPLDRQYTAIADAEFLINGVQPHPAYPLPPLSVGVSPVFITHAIVKKLAIPTYLFNAGLPQPPTVTAIDLGGIPANCLSFGKALPREIVEKLFQQGLIWGEKLTKKAEGSYLILGECVVGGTTTALAILTGLGINAAGKVNSSHPHCNHEQKWSIVQAGFKAAGFVPFSSEIDPFDLVAAVGDPMQIVVAAMAIAASEKIGVLLAGGTQMLAVYALIEAILQIGTVRGNLERLVVGTTRWVAEDITGDTVGLAEEIGKVPLFATQLNFTTSRYPNLRVYEQGYVKEGVGGGGCAIAAHLYQNWTNQQILDAIETLLDSVVKWGLNDL